MGAKKSKPAAPPPPPPAGCHVIDAAKGITDYAWIDSTSRNGGTAVSGGTMLCLKKCRPGDTPHLGSDNRPTGLLIYSEKVVRPSGSVNNAGETYNPKSYPACSNPKCANFDNQPINGCIR